MLACSLGDRSRGILNGNPNTELPVSSRPGVEIRSAGTALAGSGASHGSQVPLPAAGAAGSIGHIPDSRSSSYKLLIPPLIPPF